MTGGAAPSEIRIGGVVRRVVVVTIRQTDWALYLARKLSDTGVDLWLLNQTTLRVEPHSLAYYRRLRQRHGLRLTLDYFLLRIVKRLARAPELVLGRGFGAPAGSGPPAHPDAAGAGYRTLNIDDINRGAGLQAFRDLQPDLVLLAGAPVLNRAAIAVARVACINPHCGISPDYAGASPFDWAIYERRFGDVGYTIHLVVPTVDAGPILAQERIAWDSTVPNVRCWPTLARAMYDRLDALARALIAGRELVARPQGPARVLPPAGFFARLVAESRRRAYARDKATATPA